MAGCPSGSTTRRRGRPPTLARCASSSPAPRARAAVAAQADRLAAPRRGRGADPPGRRGGSAGQAVAVPGGPAGPRARHPGAAAARPNSDEFVAELTELAPDACAVVAYGALLSERLLAVPAHGWVNLHFSLLPAWRGAAPVQAAIAAGDAVTGATTFQIEPALDSGPGLRRGDRDDPARPTPRAICLSGLPFRERRCWRRRSTASPTDR